MEKEDPILSAARRKSREAYDMFLKRDGRSDPNAIDPRKIEKALKWIPLIALLVLLQSFLGGIIHLIQNIPMGYILLTIVVLVLLASIKQINQYERGVKFTIGKYSGIMDPGWRLVIPVFQSYQKVDMRVRAVDVPDQEAITKDNISVTVNAVIYYRISDAPRAILEVENVYYAVSQLAQTTMRNVVGEVDLDELLSNRDAIAERIRTIVDAASDAWGVKVNSVELKDVTLPEEMKRVIGKQAEAERERRAVIIKAEGEVVAAENIARAAGILSRESGSLHLRTLHSINDISSDQSNTVIFAVPLEVLRAFENIGKKSI